MQTLFGVLSIVSVLAFIVAMVKPALFMNKKTGEVPERKDLAAGAIALFLFSIVMVQFLANNSNKNVPTEINIPTSTPPALDDKSPPVEPVLSPDTNKTQATLPPAHQYVLRDGYDYGYEPALTKEDADKGRLASELLMFKYSGTRGETVQVYQEKDNVTGVVECVYPCEFIKLSTYSGRRLVSSERLRRVDGMIASMAISDAIDEQLERYVVERDGVKFNVWWDEHGPEFTAIQ